MISFENILSKLISKLKKKPDYQLKTDYKLKDYYYILFYRGMQILRGFLKRLKIKSVKGLFFCGRSVIIEHGYLIKAGRNLIIEDKVFINALSDKGFNFGNNVTIGRGAQIVCTGVVANKGVGLTIGNDSYIGAQSFIGSQGGIEIGNEVILGPGVKIFSENHNFENLEITIKNQGENRKGVIIKDNCWIGSAVIILDGVILESGTVVAAGSVITKSFPSNSVIGGIPAKIIKMRG